jgi:hypothetical protein
MRWKILDYSFGRSETKSRPPRRARNWFAAASWTVAVANLIQPPCWVVAARAWSIDKTALHHRLVIGVFAVTAIGVLVGVAGLFKRDFAITSPLLALLANIFILVFYGCFAIQSFHFD